MIHRPLNVALVVPDVEGIAGGAVDLDLGSSRQLRSRRGVDEGGRARALRNPLRGRLAENRGGLHAQQSGRRRGQGQVLIHGPLQLRFETLHLGVAGIDDGGDAVLALNGGLHVVPSLVENGAIGAQPVIQPVGLPPQLEIGERVRGVGPRRRQTVVAAGPKARGPGEVHHGGRIDLILQADLVSLAVFDHLLVGVDAGPVASGVNAGRGHDRISFRQTQRFTCAGRIAVVVETEEAIECVVHPELADTPGYLQRVGHVEGAFAECRIVAVGAIHLRQVIHVLLSSDLVENRQVRDVEARADVVRLPLVEEARGRPETIFGRRGDPEFVALLGVLVRVLRVLHRAVEQMSRRVDEAGVFVLMAGHLSLCVVRYRVL